MSVPLDRLYNFLDGLCNHPIIIYRWTPHGSKKPEDCHPLKDYPATIGYKDFISFTHLFCYDQEPLDFSMFEQTLPEFIIPGTEFSVLRLLPRVQPFIVNDKVLLLHSEKNSQEVEKFKNNGAIDVYYWSHALISLDWYRYAKIDPELNKQSNFIYDFLVYNRAWSGTREYRLKFSELIVENNLVANCKMNFSENDNGMHYTEHKFKNKNFQITNFSLENYYQQNNASSFYSADYSAEDYNQCRIDIVLETLFDDNRIHLTEKTLRPIACGKPFMLIGTCGSLAYLRSYGFKTFSEFINEDYDNIQDPIERLRAVVAAMKEFNSLGNDTKNKFFIEMQKISDYNKQRFFSDDFFNSIINEFKNNFNQAIDQFNKTNTTHYFIRAANVHINDTRQYYQSEKYKILSDFLVETKNKNS